ncbi:GNAT family N-acetyltransferase [Mucilaginibacter pedocola]|uniref:Uncharacterized protein n=1 Tax=Mucilaginibacter pedocola TaxID=1792845 RepID=A0A1S9P8M7_9SPHI|nr:GNAT family N-acetyltransferase [Mucilaginibacter pedocola]OOQ57269.1 hypothetical protein BC343_14225 [Mucilaginibacter pedocola]
MQTLTEPIESITLPGGYRAERFSAQKLDCLNYLYAAVYNKLPPKEYFLQKYNTSFAVVSYTGYLAYSDDGLPAAFYAVLPCFVEHEGRLILAAQSADTMTHPGHRNQGLFVALAELTYSLCRKEGIRLVFGFPNQNSLPGFMNKLGWQAAGQLERFALPVKTMPLEKLAAKLSFLSPLYKWYVNLRLAKAQRSGIANSVLANGYAGLYRDEDFLAYKTYTPTYAMQFGRTWVWFKIQNGMQVGDMLGPTGDVDATVQQLIKLCTKLGLQQIQWQVTTKSQSYPLLKKYASPLLSFTIGIKDLGAGIAPQQFDFTFADIDIF